MISRIVIRVVALLGAAWSIAPACASKSEGTDSNTRGIECQTDTDCSDATSWSCVGGRCEGKIGDSGTPITTGGTGGNSGSGGSGGAARDAQSAGGATTGGSHETGASSGGARVDAGRIGREDSGDCAPMDAHTGNLPCVTIVGYTWTGANCAPVVCSCDGADCASMYRTETECRGARAACAGPFTCVNPVPVTRGGSSTGPSGGFVKCENGDVHRPAPSECWSDLELPDASRPIPGANDASVCRTNDDCTELPYGHCTTFRRLSPFSQHERTIGCAYGCLRDSDCGQDQICFCGSPVGTCVKATCRTDADCPQGVACLLTRLPDEFCFVESVIFLCDGACHADSDCGPPGLVACRRGGCISLPPPC